MQQTSPPTHMHDLCPVRVYQRLGSKPSRFSFSSDTTLHLLGLLIAFGSRLGTGLLVCFQCHLSARRLMVDFANRLSLGHRTTLFTLFGFVHGDNMASGFFANWLSLGHRTTLFGNQFLGLLFRIVLVRLCLRSL